MINQCYQGDVRDGLRAFIAAGTRAQTCVTSPPYWGLRDYGHAGQIGLEPTPAEYVERMVEVFRLVRDVLADDGTLWLNLGDSYATGAGGVGDCPGGGKQGEAWKERGAMTAPNRLKLPGLKPKDLIGVPWRVALALQADGWYLRSDIIWHKPNPMPESVTDRPTKAHEYLFLLAKSERYYYNAAAIEERALQPRGEERRTGQDNAAGNGKLKASGAAGTNGTSTSILGSNQGREWRNRRTVWTVATLPYAGAHFATFPPALVEPCILAGSRVGDVVLDPFMGSGTVAEVAQSFGRRWIGCELNPDYIALQRKRTAQTGLLARMIAHPFGENGEQDDRFFPLT